MLIATAGRGGVGRVAALPAAGGGAVVVAAAAAAGGVVLTGLLVRRGVSTGYVLLALLASSVRPPASDEAEVWR